MDNRACITLTVAGQQRFIAADVVLADLARKLATVELAAGMHEIIIRTNGTILLNGRIQWQPKKRPVAIVYQGGMDKPTSDHYQPVGHGPPVAQNTDYPVRKCLNCGKSFIAVKANYLCCCWQCSHEHKKAMREPDLLDEGYQGHPF